ncbi:MAG: 2-hydroxymuconate tautomerase [Dehalococcoidales bacterium]
MPVVTVEMWQGRTIEQKKMLARGITDQFTKTGTPADQVHIIFKDNARHNWAIGGVLVSEEAPATRDNEDSDASGDVGE